ncbi:Ferrous iron transport protein B [hydrothermal vent metagenome]|uniref:Ferrous iron transport protein B n=1 Tax=hydrothermal vent metagenome TaxID=652676 RepID=A0A3B1DGE1_9ZZZZ
MTTTEEQPQTYSVAIIGNPNTGKSTLFNSLVGARARVGNYPGVTVEKKTGILEFGSTTIELVDLPGTYSLSPRSIDEMLAVDVLLGRQKNVPPIDAALCIVDASNIERNLYLFSQMMELEVPLVLVLNMCDVAKSRGIILDAKSLSAKLGLPVVCTEAHKGIGFDEIQKAILDVVTQSPPASPDLFPQVFIEQRAELQKQLQVETQTTIPNFLGERLLLDVGGYVESYFAKQSQNGLAEYLTEARAKLKEAGFPVPVSEAKMRYKWVRQLLEGIIEHPEEHPVTTSDKIDGWLTHRFFGFLFFVCLMFFVFQSVFTWAEPFMKSIEAAQGWVGGLIISVMSPGSFRSLLVDGVVGGVGGVLTFLPQIVFLYLFIAILEDCGYMSRAAFIMDRLMRSLGLSGKSFIPLMSSFACAVPGVMAARVIEDRRERLATILIAPLMSCSARWPVYVLFVSAFIPTTVYVTGVVTLQGLVLFGMSSLGLLVAIPIAWILKKIYFKGEPSPFVMELPSYKFPSVKNVVFRVYDRAKSFVTKAGTLIFVTSILVWAAGFFPKDHSEQFALQTKIETLESQRQPIEAKATTTQQAETKEKNTPIQQKIDTFNNQKNKLSSKLLEESYLGQAGHFIEPVVKPLGWDWKIGVGTLASFPAREVIIGTLGTIYSLGGDVNEEDETLVGSIQASRWQDGTKVFNIPVALSVMVFFALCAQCAATLMVIKRETNSWFWPLFSFTYMTTLGYVGAFITYQVGMMIGQ